ncbi:MAG: ribosome-binding factor A [Gammaproteobacteria bacterium]|nr:MAG: ribosome-binding factor A [Gammaproteobacteria bacterium]
MAREFSRTQRVAEYLQRDLASIIQREIRDPRVGMVSITSVDVSRDLAYAKVFFTMLGVDNAEQAKEPAEALNHAAGYLRSTLSRSSTMRSVPRLRFYFDASVGRGRDMEALIQRAIKADDHAPEDE